MICNKALRVFGFIRWKCSEFKNLKCIKVLYFSLVRSILEYDSVIWNPHQSNLISRIECIQNRLLWVLAYKTNKLNLSIEQLTLAFDIEPLVNLRKLNDVLWLHKLLNSKIDCPELLSLILFNVPCVITHAPHSFYCPTYSQNYSIFAPINRMLTTANSLNNFHFFMMTQPS